MSRDLRVLAAALFVWGLGEGLFFYFQPLYLQKLGASPETIGAVLGAAGLVMSLTHIPAGALSDRIGRRPLLWASWFTGLTAAVIMAAARTLTVFTVGLLMYSLSAFVIAPINSYITAARGRWSVSRALTTMTATFNTGAVLGALIGGRLGQWLGLENVYRFAAGLFAISVVLALRIRPQPVAVQPAREDAAPEGGLLRHFRPRFWAFLAFVFVVMLVLYLPQPLAPNFLSDVRHTTLGNIGLLGALARGGMVLFSLVLGSFGAWEGFLAAQVLGGLFPLLIWQGNGMVWYSLAYFFLGGYWASKTLAAAEVRSLVSSEAVMGLAYGLNETVGGLAIFAGAALAGRMYAANPEAPLRWTVYLLPLLLLGNIPFHPRWRNSAGKSKKHSQNAPP